MREVDPETCDCEWCTDTRKACDDHGITDPEERCLVRELVEAHACVCDVMIAADEAGFDFERPEIQGVMDQIFDETKPTLN